MSDHKEMAFPVHVKDAVMGDIFNEGMTLRDYFAAKAMQGMIVHYGSQGIGLASLSYEIADGMLSEREKGQ